MAIAAMVNGSGLVASREGGRPDSAGASFAALADMGWIVAADSSRAPRARQTLHRSAAVENARRNPAAYSTEDGTETGSALDEPGNRHGSDHTNGSPQPQSSMPGCTTTQTEAC